MDLSNKKDYQDWIYAVAAEKYDGLSDEKVQLVARVICNTYKWNVDDFLNDIDSTIEKDYDE